MFAAWPGNYFDMNYYEKLVKHVSQSMKKHPRSAIVMDMSNFQILAKGSSLAVVNKKMSGKTSGNTIVFQIPPRQLI